MPSICRAHTTLSRSLECIEQKLLPVQGRCDISDAVFLLMAHCTRMVATTTQPLVCAGYHCRNAQAGEVRSFEAAHAL